MNAQETSEIINAVTSALSGPSQAVVEEYTRYMFLSSAAYIALGGLFVWAAKALWQRKDAEEFHFVIAVIVALIGLAFIACNLGDLVAPKAAAVHQFIRDLRAA